MMMITVALTIITMKDTSNTENNSDTSIIIIIIDTDFIRISRKAQIMQILNSDFNPPMPIYVIKTYQPLKILRRQPGIW